MVVSINYNIDRLRRDYEVTYVFFPNSFMSPERVSERKLLAKRVDALYTLRWMFMIYLIVPIGMIFVQYGGTCALRNCVSK